MNDSTKFALLKDATKITDESILSAYLDLAQETILSLMYPYADTFEDLEMPQKYDSVQVEMATYFINKRGAEGETVHLEDSVSRHYESGTIPDSLRRRIVPMAQVIK